MPQPPAGSWDQSEIHHGPMTACQLHHSENEALICYLFFNRSRREGNTCEREREKAGLESSNKASWQVGQACNSSTQEAEECWVP
jgi:hypothetical protein